MVKYLMGDSTGSEEAIIRLLQSSTSLALSKDPNSHRRQLKLILFHKTFQQRSTSWTTRSSWPSLGG